MTGSADSRRSVLHLITGLGVGGAELTLYKILSRLDPARFSSRVVSMTDAGPIGERIQALGIPVTALGMRRGVPHPSGLLRLRELVRQTQPDILQTWMYHADFLGLFAGAHQRGIPLVWNIRHSSLEHGGSRALTRWIARFCARASRRTSAIVVCSNAALHAHARLGYANDRMVLIPNGYDLELFRPDPAARAAVREELGIPPDVPVVGMVARLHPDKGHSVFAQAAIELAAANPHLHFVLCGEGVVEDAAPFRELQGAVNGRLRLLGRRDDVSRLLPSFDVAVSASLSEGFPNSVCEAMACEVPCVATAVGETEQIVGDTGIIIAPGSPEQLAAGVHELLQRGADGRRRLGERARERIATSYSIERVIRSYEALYATI